MSRRRLAQMDQVTQGVRGPCALEPGSHFLGLQFGGTTPSPAELAQARSLAGARLADLQADRDTPALVFGEGYLAQWTLDALDRLAAAPPSAPAGSGR